MHHRVSFAIGILVSQLFKHQPTSFDPVEVTLLKSEIAQTRVQLDEYLTRQSWCEWNSWISSWLLRANLVFDLIVLAYWFFVGFARRPVIVTGVKADTGGSSDSESCEEAPTGQLTQSLTDLRVKQIAVVKTRPTRPSDLK